MDYRKFIPAANLFLPQIKKRAQEDRVRDIEADLARDYTFDIKGMCDRCCMDDDWVRNTEKGGLKICRQCSQVSP